MMMMTNARAQQHEMAVSTVLDEEKSDDKKYQTKTEFNEKIEKVDQKK
jgi:hypothetical protein